jgi:shikimate kinase
MRIFLIGFMCSGKTKVGRALAQLLDRAWVDIDRTIEERIGPLTPWVQRHGEAAFRELERDVLHALLSREDVVISCGGGTPAAFDNMDRMLAHGTVVWLDVPLEVLVQRCARYGTDRPLLFGLKGETLRERVETLLAERRAIYARAPLQVTAVEAPEAVAERIQAMIAAQER